MKVLKASFVADETIIETTDEFEALDYVAKLDVLKDLIYDLRSIYSDIHKEWATLHPIVRRNRQINITAQANERAKMAYKYRQDGMTFTSIGKQMNVSSTRAQQLVEKAERLLKQEAERG